jgi:ketosteroid isomerase-like protein
MADRARIYGVSNEAVERALRGYDAYNRGDVDAFVETFHPEIEWHFNPAFLDRAGEVLRGHEGMRRYFADDVEALWREYEAQPEEIHDLGSHLFIVARFQGVGRQSGVSVNFRLYDLFTLRDDLAVKRESFTEREHALEAMRRAGLNPPESS